MAEMNIREDFPIFRDNPSLVYLDNAATTQKPSCVIEAVRHFYERDNANPLRGLYDLAQRATAVYEDSREAVAEFIGAAGPEEVVFTRNASESLNLVAYSYGTFLKEGDEILISVMEHHSNLIPWQQLAARNGAVLKFIECGMDGRITEGAFRAALSPRTKIVSMTQISNVLGVRNDIKTLPAWPMKRARSLSVTAPRASPIFLLTCRIWTSIFWPFPATRCWRPWASACYTAKKPCLKRCPLS